MVINDQEKREKLRDLHLLLELDRYIQQTVLIGVSFPHFTQLDEIIIGVVESLPPGDHQPPPRTTTTTTHDLNRCQFSEEKGLVVFASSPPPPTLLPKHAHHIYYYILSGKSTLNSQQMAQ